MAFFTFNNDGTTVQCNVLNDRTPAAERAIIVEKGQWHAMTAAPASLGWPGYAVVFETSGHKYDMNAPTKVTYSLLTQKQGTIRKISQCTFSVLSFFFRFLQPSHLCLVMEWMEIQHILQLL